MWHVSHWGIYNNFKCENIIFNMLYFSLVMLINGAMGYTETPDNQQDVYLVITIFGAIFFSLSILLFGKYI